MRLSVTWANSSTNLNWADYKLSLVKVKVNHYDYDYHNHDHRHNHNDNHLINSINDYDNHNDIYKILLKHYCAIKKSRCKAHKFKIKS